MEKYINNYLNKMLETKSETTVKGHKSTLNTFAKYVNVSEPIEVLVKDVVNFRNDIYKEKKASTVNTMLKRIKLFFNWCTEEGIIDLSPAEEVKLLTEAEALPKWLTEEQEDLLLKAIKKKYLGSTSKKKSYRELAIVLLMLKAGLRVGEVVDLKWSEVQLTGDKGKALIRGKAQQQRTVPLISDVVSVLNQYKEVNGVKGEYVFYSQVSYQLTERYVQKIVKEFEGIAGKNVIINELHPHMLRHTFAHNLARSGMSLEAIARVLGHMKKNGEPNIQQTIRYTKASESEIADDLERILSLS